MANINGAARRAQIVAAAREICMEKGFARMSVSDITTRAHMTRSLFYHYFDGKDEVASAVLDDVIDEILARLEGWNAAREPGNIAKALDDMIALVHVILDEDSPFHNRLVQAGNAELYIRFIDRAADRIADYFCETVLRDFEQLHGSVPIENPHETFFILIVGLISLLRSHPELPDAAIRQLAAQTVHIEGYLD